MRLAVVIATAGTRTRLLDELVVPAVLEQRIPGLELVLVGSYTGRHEDRAPVRVVPAPVGGELFYKPFQQGVLAASAEWIVDLDDDMVLPEGWWESVSAALARVRTAVVLGFPLVAPDGQTLGGWFDAVDNRLSGTGASTLTYFSAYVAPRSLFLVVPYPTYLSGDRAHAARLRRAGPPHERRLLDEAPVLHAGENVRHRGVVPRSDEALIARSRRLQREALALGVPWMAFGDAVLDGRPDVTLETARQTLAEMARAGSAGTGDNWLY